LAKPKIDKPKKTCMIHARINKFMKQMNEHIVKKIELGLAWLSQPGSLYISEPGGGFD
jgi:hypothetical protein